MVVVVVVVVVVDGGGGGGGGGDGLLTLFSLHPCTCIDAITEDFVSLLLNHCENEGSDPLFSQV